MCEQITLHSDHQWIQKGCNKKHIDFFRSTKQEHILPYMINICQNFLRDNIFVPSGCL